MGHLRNQLDPLASHDEFDEYPESKLRTAHWRTLKPRKAIILLITSLMTIALFLASGSNYLIRPWNLMPLRDSQPLCKNYTPLYDDAIRTQEYFRRRGGITEADLDAARVHCKWNGNCVQVKLYGGNLFVGNISQNPRCYESRAESLILNLYRATEQARMENERLPDIDVFLHCDDRPVVEAAIWNLVKTRGQADADALNDNGERNFFLMPDFNFYSWPEAYNEPWT
jgi:hypothetical protein